MPYVGEPRRASNLKVVASAAAVPEMLVAVVDRAERLHRHLLEVRRVEDLVARVRERGVEATLVGLPLADQPRERTPFIRHGGDSIQPGGRV